MIENNDIDVGMNKFVNQFKNLFKSYYGKEYKLKMTIHKKPVPVIPPTLGEIETCVNTILWKNPGLSIPEGIKTKTRNRVVVLHRQCFFYIGACMGYSEWKMGDFLGKFNHSTVNHSKCTIQDFLEIKDTYVKNLINDIKNELKEKFGYDRSIQYHSPKSINA